VADEQHPGLLLGKIAPAVAHYAPELLFPIERREARSRLPAGALDRAHGVDRWHAYELSWLDSAGCAQARVGRFDIPATTPRIVESKSFKLYLNSLNNTRFDTEAALVSTIVRDIGAAAGGEVSLTLFDPGAPVLAGTALAGACLDDLAVPVPDREPGAELIEPAADGIEVTETLYTHLLRSLCPVTAQPDWATLWLSYSGHAIDHASLLRYVLAFREHQEFHEQCVERIFADIMARCAPTQLAVQGFYTRRGGMDINPFRSTDPVAAPLPRMDRQ
jgi:7-cyano-7-deazaguanine reductase